MDVSILTISCGSHRYAEMAFNLVISAKFLCPSVKVAVLTDGNIRKEMLPVFDHIIPFSGNPFEAKTKLNLLTPFDKTLYLDADTVCLPGRSLPDFLRLLDSISFSAFNYGWFDSESGWLSKWCTVSEIQRISGTSKPVPAYQSSAIYFDKSPKVKEFFGYASEFYAKIHSKVMVKGFQPDEMAFSCAGAITQLKPEMEMPVAFCDTKGSRTDILENYQFLSLAGAIIPDAALGLYTNVTTTAARQTGKTAYKFDVKAKRMK